MNATKLYTKLSKMDFSKVDQRVERNKLGGNSIGAVRKETLKFLALCATDSEPNAPSKIVDEYWHAMILNTALYDETAKVLGTKIHHDQHVPRYRKFFTKTIDKIEAVFGEANEKIWKAGYANCGYGGCGVKSKVASAKCGSGGNSSCAASAAAKCACEGKVKE